MTVYDTTNASLFSPNGSDLLLNTGLTNNPPNGGGGPQNTTPVTVNVTYPPGTTAITIIMNQFGNPDAPGGDAWTYTAGAPITNYQYLVFTDNTNLATDPIKFAEPPFNFTEFSTNYLLSDFNLATNGDYLAPTNIYDAYGGWNVPTNLVTYPTIVTNGQLVVVTNVVRLMNNLVSVITDPSTALTGDAGSSNLSGARQRHDHALDCHCSRPDLQCDVLVSRPWHRGLVARRRQRHRQFRPGKQ